MGRFSLWLESLSLDPDLIGRAGDRVASEVIASWTFLSSRGASGFHGRADMVSKVIWLPTSGDRLHVTQHELAHLVNDLLPDGLGAEVLAAVRSGAASPGTALHMRGYGDLNVASQEDEALAEEIAQRNLLARQAQRLLDHFDRLRAAEPDAGRVREVLRGGSGLVGGRLAQWRDYLENLLFIMEEEGASFGEAVEELRRNVPTGYHGLEEGEELEVLELVVNAVLGKQKSP